MADKKADAPKADAKKKDDDLDGSGLRKIVKVNKPTDDTPGRQQLDPLFPKTEVDPDPTGQDKVGRYNEDQRATGDEDVVFDGFEHLQADSDEHKAALKEEEDK